MASEKKQRCLSKDLITTRITAEVTSFTHALKRGGEELKPDAVAYIPSLPDKVWISKLARYYRFVIQA